MTEVGECECKSQKEVRAPRTDNDMNECINKYAKDHIKAPNEWNEDIHMNMEDAILYFFNSCLVQTHNKTVFLLFCAHTFSLISSDEDCCQSVEELLVNIIIVVAVIYDEEK